eukprot:NODE_2556_length_583_cov_7.531835_g2184_i0.p4 GENE.NODE_2556_length_583_cov_7.531835_g2184_i0~~NODE_2556_length_583_cov_7.531835_g2184_i0.p4  ORF type:complete len:64 (-),score=1.60 NODE_2556_length_583_cov_7.531835_g2184_i0:279-470(-)
MPYRNIRHSLGSVQGGDANIFPCGRPFRLLEHQKAAAIESHGPIEPTSGLQRLTPRQLRENGS